MQRFNGTHKTAIAEKTGCGGRERQRDRKAERQRERWRDRDRETL